MLIWYIKLLNSRIKWVENEFNIKVKDDNEADAISIAWTHVLSRQFESLSKE